MPHELLSRIRNLCLAGLAVGALGCGGGMPDWQRDEIIEAAAITGIAATLWIVADGCKLQGCSWGTYCDTGQGRCVAVSCEDGCPSSTECNEAIDRCQDLPDATLDADGRPPYAPGMRPRPDPSRMPL